MGEGVAATALGWVRAHLGVRFVAVVVTASLVAGTLVLGEPSRPATATVVRPISTVQALCTQPTIVDVAAGEATRSLSAVNTLLDLEEPVALEAARDVTIADTDAGTYFVAIRDAELRLSVLRPTGLPLLAYTSDPDVRRTHRAFDLPAGLAGQDTTVIPGEDGVYVLFGGSGTPASVVRLDQSTMTSPSAELSAGQAPTGVEVDEPGAGPGRAVTQGQLLWVAADDGSVWTYDAAVEAGDRWVELDQGLSGGVLSAEEDLVHGVFAGDDGRAELRSWSTPGAEPSVVTLRDRDVAVEAAAVEASDLPGFLLRSADGPDRAAVLVPRGDDVEVTWTEGEHVTDPIIGLVLHRQATALLTDAPGNIAYHLIDEDGDHVGTTGRQPGEADCVTTTGWPDAGDVVQALSAGSFLHLHHPDSQFDCVVDTRGDLGDLDANCAPGGAWSVDKGAAPDSDFTVEIERAIEEFRDDDDQEEDAEEGDEADESDGDDANGSDEPEATESVEDEFADIGLGITEVDEDLTEVCAAEEVTAVVAPDLEGLEAVGDRGIRVDWSWSGGRCLPERYVIDICLLSSDGSACSEERSEELVDRDGASNRLSTEVSSRPGRTYRVTVTAVKQGVSSSPSGSLTIATPPAVPAPPSAVSATLGSSGTWSLSWASCLDDRSCDQRPEGFEIAIEGCDGDSLSRMTQRVGSGDRSASYSLGSGFNGTDLLGRKVRFTVAAYAAGNLSDRVPAGSCQETTRPGRTVSYGDSPVSLALSGRTTSMSLEAPGRGSGLLSLFGLSSYDDVSARLVRSSGATSSRSGALGSSVSFDVARCELTGWTVELTPRRGGQALSNHQARITGVPAACGWSVTDSTQSSVRVRGGNAEGVDVEVTIPGLREDVRTDKVERVRASVSCARWNGGTSEPSVSSGSIDGDVVRFSVATPAVFDLAGACTLAPRVDGRDGSTVAPRSASMDLTSVGSAVVARVGPAVVEAMRGGAMTGEYVERRQGGPRRPNNSVEVTLDVSGLGCTVTAGSSTWRLRAEGGRSDDISCSGQTRSMEFRSAQLSDSGRGDITYRVRLEGGSSHERTVETDICGLPDGERLPPCRTIELCEFDSDLAADDEDCRPQCPWDSDLLEGDAGCFEPCPTDSEIPADDDDCVPEPEPCEWDPDLSEDDPACVEPPDDEDEGDNGEDNGDDGGDGNGNGDADPDDP